MRQKVLRGTSVLTLVGLFVMMAGAAFADDVSNRLDTSVDAVAEVMPLTVGGANGTTQLFVLERNGDGKNGCNLTGSTTLVLSVASNNTSVATVSPSSVTLTSCGATPTLTITPHSQGSATISVAQTSNTTGASFNLVPATFTVNVVPPPNTPPQVSIAGVAGGEGYVKGSVPIATCEVTDAEDGNSSPPATLSAVTGPYADDGIGQQTASCSYTDRGGLQASASVTYSIVDPSPPSIGYDLDPVAPDGDNGWYRGDVSLTWVVSEPQSPNSLIKADCVDQNITADQAEASYSCSATSAGGSTGRVTVTIKRDATKPGISASVSPSSPDGQNGWYVTAPTVTFTCSDARSGVQSCVADGELGYSWTLGEGMNQSVSGTATDWAGNTAHATSPDIDVDLTAPDTVRAAVNRPPDSNGWYNHPVGFTFAGNDSTSGVASCSTPSYSGPDGTGLTVGGSCTDLAGWKSEPVDSDVFNYDATAPVASVTGVQPGAIYVLGNVPTAGCSTDDNLSGVATNASLAVTGGPLGSVTASCGGAVDNAGNEQEPSSVTYSVVYDWRGFFSPVNNLPTLNAAKAGSAIPTKFSLAGNQGMTIMADGYPKSQVISCDSTAPVDGIEQTVTAGWSSLSYDSVLDQYNYVWKSDKAWAGTCRQLVVKLSDGTYHRANFRLTK
jgi:hypothetical protein